MKKNFLGIKALVLIGLLFFVNLSYALPFSIVPSATLPQSVPSGGTVSASYIVTNNTGSIRVGNYVKWLPPNVIQNLAGTNACQTNFTLGSHNSSNDHCTLNLTVFGAVNASDPDPHHHLFVCFPAGTTCAGTDFPLNVTVTTPLLVSIAVTPLNPAIPRNTTQQFSATGTYNNGQTLNISSSVSWNSSDTSIATISSAGLATGVGAGSSTITATLGSVSGSTVLKINPILAYIANFGTNTVKICSINSNTGLLINCRDSGVGSVFDNPGVVQLNIARMMAYISNFAGSIGTIVSLCSVNASTGELSGCGNSDGDGTAVFDGPLGITLDSSTTHAFIPSINANTVALCTIQSNTGKLINCVNTGGGFVSPISVTFNSGTSQVYVSNTGNGSLSLCSIDFNTGQLTNCVNADGDGSAVFNGPAIISLNSDRSRIYVSDNGGGAGTSVSMCTVNMSTGKLFSCEDSGVGPIFNAPVAVSLNKTNTFGYVSNNASTTISLCSVNVNTGKFISCTNADGDGSAVFSAPAGIQLV